MDSSINIQNLIFKGMGGQRHTLIALLRLNVCEEEKNLLLPPGSEPRTSISYILYRVSDIFLHRLTSDISVNTTLGELIFLPLPGTG